MIGHTQTEHSVSSLFSLLLFGLFVLFLLLMLLFSARIYQQTVRSADSESSLGTAVSYITTKFRQHDSEGDIFTGTLDDIPALCFRDVIEDTEYITYLYLDGTDLKELFTVSGSQAASNAGTSIATLSDFQITESGNGFYHLLLKDSDSHEETLVLHQNSSAKEAA